MPNLAISRLSHGPARVLSSLYKSEGAAFFLHADTISTWFQTIELDRNPLYSRVQWVLADGHTLAQCVAIVELVGLVCLRMNGGRSLLLFLILESLGLLDLIGHFNKHSFQITYISAVCVLLLLTLLFDGDSASSSTINQRASNLVVPNPSPAADVVETIPKAQVAQMVRVLNGKWSKNEDYWLLIV
jgi:hypothetical protein